MSASLFQPVNFDCLFQGLEFRLAGHKRGASFFGERSGESISVSNAIGRFVDHRLSRHFQIVTDANNFYRQQCDFVLSIEDYPLDVRVDVERGRTQKADQGLIAFARKLNRKTRRRRD